MQLSPQSHPHEHVSPALGHLTGLGLREMTANGNLSKVKTKSPVNSGVPEGLGNTAEGS